MDIRFLTRSLRLEQSSCDRDTVESHVRPGKGDLPTCFGHIDEVLWDI